MKSNGFTLIELVLTLTLCSILMLCSLTLSGSFREKNEQQMLIEEIKNAIHYAKITALSKGQAMLLSAKESESDWSKGMNLTPYRKKNLIHQWSWKYDHWSVQWIGVHGDHTIYIEGNTSKAMSNGHFVITNKHTKEQVLLVLNRLGRVKVST